jgi:energy-coupling factor transport system permease protein
MDAGFYATGTSLLHRTHATAKILLFAVAIPLIPFLLRHWTSLVLLAVLLGSLLVLARVRRRQLLTFAPAMPIILIAGLSWLFADQGGAIIAEWQLGTWSYVLRSHTLDRALTGMLRTLVWVLAAMALLTTTSSRELVAGLDRLGVPDRVSRAVAMTLRFWAIAIADAGHVADAQQVRGVDFARAAPWRTLVQRFLISGVPTLFVLLKRFQTLTFALALRGVGAPGPKTRLYAPPLRRRDAVFLGLSALALLLLWAGDQARFAR